MTTDTDPMAPIAAASRCRRLHGVEYLLEGLELGLFMLSACTVVALVEHPASPLRSVVLDATLRRVLVGVAMGLTAVLLIYSPWGQRSGAHMNPAVTLAFLRLGKIEPLDAVMYVLAQFLGASAGVFAARALLGDVISHETVCFVVTEPAPGRALLAFFSELGISTLLMSVVLASSRSERLRPLTGLMCGMLVALYISVEAPLSGMSMNPARSFGSALAAGRFEHLWLYLLAPALGMLLAAEVFARLPEPERGSCAKLHHSPRRPCIFCRHSPRPEPARSSHAGACAET
jgi:aquaporin Z